VVVGALLTLVLALFIYWLAERKAAEPDTPLVAGAEQAAARPLSGPPNPNLPDPADSGGAVYAVLIASANTQTAAILKLQDQRLKLPASTYAPVSIQGTTWFNVLAGAFQASGDAESMLASLRGSGVLDSTEGVVVRVPFSVRIDSVPTATVDDYLAQLRVGRSLPAYPLMQKNGWVWIMVGAFESESQADHYAETLRAVGLTPQVVRRKGRTF
jgi:cell division septation protein DedD